jgi:hypothetical protein
MHGSQLFLKLQTDNNGVLFMTAAPERWVELKEVGNIVVEVTLLDYNGTVVVTDIREVDV